MEEIALINPPRRKRRKSKGGRRRNAARRDAGGRFAASKNPGRRRRTTSASPRRRRRNPELMLLNPGTRRRHHRRNDPGRRRHYRSNMPARRRHYRRNPGMMDEFLPKATLPNIAWGAGGALGTAAVSRLFLPQATGIMGLLRDAVSVLGIGWVAKQVGGREAQTAAIIGGGTVLAVKLLNTMGIGRGFGLAEMADDDYNELGAYYEDPSLGAYYEDPSLDVPWQGGTMAGLGAYYEDPSLGAIEEYDEPGLFDLGEEYDELGDDEDELEDYDADELGDDEEEELDDDEEDELEDYDADSLGDDEEEMGMF